jgi:hypothetical protein
LKHFTFCLKKKAMRAKDAEIMLYQALVNFEANELDQALVSQSIFTPYSFGDLSLILSTGSLA